MNAITLTNTAPSGEKLEAVFLSDKGMNMASFKMGGIEVIDQTTRKGFEEKFGGLGALIGPHFHRRIPSLIPKVDEKVFPHSVYFKHDERPDPFSHGIGRYAPWKAAFTKSDFHAKLSGKDVWREAVLSQLEGQNFEMRFSGSLKPEGLELELSVVSDSASIVGIHYYYGLPAGKGTIYSQIQNYYMENKEKKPLPKDWMIDSENRLTFPLDQAADFTFYPYPDPLRCKIILEAETHQLITTYQCDSRENSWQLWHPEGASFVCIEPVSAEDPRRPNLTASSIRIQLQIVKK